MLRRVTAIAVAAALVAGAAIGVAPMASAATVDSPDFTTLKVADVDLAGTMQQLRWAPVTGAVAYSVSLSVSDPSVTTGVYTAVTYTNSFSPTAYLATVAAAQTVYWKVASYASSVSSANLGAYSAVASFARAQIDAPNPLSPLGTDATPATIVYPAAVSFSWDPVPGAVSYTVSYSQSESFASAVTSATTSATSYTPATTFSRDATWYWHVVANILTVTFSGTSTTSIATSPSTAQAFVLIWDNPATSGSDESQPQLLPPDGVTSTSGTPWLTDPMLSWQPVQGAASYQLALGTAEQNGQITNPTVYPVYTGTTFVPPVLLADQDYFWQVTAVDTAGKKGTPSAIVEFHKAWGSQPGATDSSLSGTTAPVPLTGSSSAGSPESINSDRLALEWNPIPRAVNYVVSVYQIIDGSPTTSPVATCTTASTVATIVTNVLQSSSAVAGMTSCLTGLAEGPTYEWGVMAVMKDPNTGSTITSAKSIDGTPRFFALTGTSPAVTLDPLNDWITGDETAWEQNLSSGGAGQASPTFSWQAVDGAQLYEVDIALNQQFTNIAASFYTTDTIFHPTGVFDDTNTQLPYFWRVRASASASGQTVYKSANPPSADPDYSWRRWEKSSTASALATTPVTQINGTTVLRWKPQADTAPNDGGSAGYVVKIYSGSSATGTPVNGTGGVKTVYPFLVAATSAGLPLTESGTYTFTVAPLDSSGAAGNASDPYTFTVESGAPVVASPVVDAGEASAVLSWNPTPNALSYIVTVTPPTGVTSLNSSGSSSPVTLTATGQTAVTITGLTGTSQSYSWTVTPSKQGSIKGATSAPQTFAVPAGSIVQGTADNRQLHAFTTDSDVGRALSWTAVPGATSYAVTITNATTGVSSVGYTIEPLLLISTSAAYGTSYTWTVKAVSGASTLSTSSAVIATSGSRTFSTLTVPSVPTVSVAVSGTTVTASWTALSTAAALGTAEPASYVVQRRVKPSDGSTDWSAAYSHSTDAGATSYAMAGLDTNVTYQVRLAAVNSEGQSGWSAIVEVKTPTAPTAAPTGLKPTPALGGFSVSWSGIPTASNGGAAILDYVLRYKTSGTSSWSAEQHVTRTSTTLTGLTPGASYDFSVTGRNIIGEGPAAELSAVSLALPGTPTGVSAIAGDRTITLSWDPPASDGGSAITGYTLQQSSYASATHSWSAWTSTSLAATTSVRSGLVDGTPYQFRVAARTKLGASAYSDVVTATPAGAPIASAKRIKVTAKKGKFIVKWSAANANGSKVTGYIVQYSTNAKKWTTLKTAKASARSYTTKKGKKGTSYYFRVTPKNAVGKGTSSVAVKAKRK